MEVSSYIAMIFFMLIKLICRKEIKTEPQEDEADKETPEYDYHPLSVYVEHHDEEEEEIKSIKSEPIDEFDETRRVKKLRKKKLIKEKKLKETICLYCNESVKNKKVHPCKYLECSAGRFICRICGVIRKKKSFSDHMRKHQISIEKLKNPKYECDLCGNKITKHENLKYHMNIHLKIPYAVCNICGAQCFSPSGWKKHSCFRKIDQPNLKIIDTLFCRYCNNRFPSAMEKKTHKCDFQIDRFKKICRVCKKVISKNSFNHHMQTHSQEIHSCNVCGKEFNNKRCLKVHLQQHEATRRYQCDKCPSSFVNKSTLEHHKRFHGEEASKRFTCDHCGRTLCSDFSLRGHIQRNHSTSKICEICKFEAPDKQLMKEHMKIHGTFSCTICNKSFALPRYLRVSSYFSYYLCVLYNRINCS